MIEYTYTGSVDDYRYMSEALALAERGLYSTDPNPRVGCLLVHAGQIVGSGWHECAGQAHAEINALQAAQTQARGATAYVTLEPCCHHGRTPPCTQALLNAGIKRVVVAMLDPNPQVAGQGLAQLRDAGVAVECGLLEAQARVLNRGFIQRMTQQRPLVRVKLAMSLDGRTALASGASQWLTGAAARLDVQRLRAQSSAIMTGSGTILGDDPQLNVRWAHSTRQPLRVILDSALRTPLHAKILQSPGKTLIFTAVADATAHAPLCAAGAEIVVLPSNNLGRLELPTVLTELAKRECNELHIECGATLAGALLEARLIDELIIYLAPIVLGDTARGLFNIRALESMQERWQLKVKEMRAVGDDWRICLRLLD